MKTRAPSAWPLFERLDRHRRMEQARRSCRAGAAAARSHFAEVERFCLFVGHPRSGHSALGTLLNAHRHVLVSHNLDALDYLRGGFGRDEVFFLILEQDRWFAGAGRTMAGDSYEVPGQWLGRDDGLRVIGDKRAGSTSRLLAADPTLLRTLPATLALPVTVIHQTRNPWDNIGSVWRKADMRRGRTLAALIEEYFMLLDGALAGLAAAAGVVDVVATSHEDLVRAPDAVLERVLAALGLDTPGDYLSACRRFVHRTPRLSRAAAPWTPALVAQVAARASRYQELAAYRFEA